MKQIILIEAKLMNRYVKKLSVCLSEVLHFFAYIYTELNLGFYMSRMLEKNF